MNDIEFCGNVTKPLALFPVPFVPGSPLVEYATLNVTAAALVWSNVIDVFPLPFAKLLFHIKKNIIL